MKNKQDKPGNIAEPSETYFSKLVICENLLCNRVNEVNRNGNLYIEEPPAKFGVINYKECKASIGKYIKMKK